MNVEPEVSEFFVAKEHSLRNPTFSHALLEQAEASLGVKLPDAYVKLLVERNGGTPRRQCFPTGFPTEWANDHLKVSRLLGIGYDDGVDGQFGTRYMVREWGYAPIGVVIFDTPSAGHDAVMLDYRACGTAGEPSVAYVNDSGEVFALAPRFADFVLGLRECGAIGA